MAKDKDSTFSQLWRASTIGIHLVAATFVGLFLGVVVDGLFGTKPWFMFIFLLLGIATGFRDMFRMINRVEDGMDMMKPEDAPRPLPSSDDEDDEEERHR